MADKKIPVTDATHALVESYRDDFGLPTFTAALTEMVEAMYAATADERHAAREARHKRLARFGVPTAPVNGRDA